MSAALPKLTDTIVVGAGSAGCVLAARLSEDPGRSVLLLESGPDYVDPADFPKDMVDARRNSLFHHDWGFVHQPTPDRKHLRFKMPRGRVVGGSSAVNTCIGLRGQPEDYDEWGALGLPDWSWAASLPYFKKLESDLDTWTHDDLHGRTGPLPLQRDPPETWRPWQAAFAQSARELGFPECPDTAIPGAHGVGSHAFNRLNGRRISAAEAWLTPEVRARPNLKIVADCDVERVTFEAGRVHGLDVYHAGESHHLIAKRVLLTAGAFGTPPILMRSGIGPADFLAKHGISALVDAKGVGARLLDHPGFAVFCLPKPGVAKNTDPLIQTVLRYQAPGSAFPASAQMQAGGNMPVGIGIVPLVNLMGTLGKPAGVGRVAWPDLKLGTKPVIHSDFLAQPEDRDRASEIMLLAWDMLHSSTMSKLATPIWPRARTMRSLAGVRKWIGFATDSGYHPCGTAPMGPESDPFAVTDGRGRVRGVEGLWIADASLMPTIPSSNIHLPVLMVAERIADWLRASA